MNRIVNKIKRLSAEFESFKAFDSFHFDIVVNDFYRGDKWLWVLSTNCNELKLITKKSIKLLSLLSEKVGARYFIIEINHKLDDCEITEYSQTDIYNAIELELSISSVSYKSRRKYYLEVLEELDSKLLAVENKYDLTAGMQKNDSLYLDLDCNSVKYCCPIKKDVRLLAIGFDLYRKVGKYKITFTSDFGHCEIEQVTVKQFDKIAKASRQTTRAA